MQQLAEKPWLHITVRDTDNLGFATNSAVFWRQWTRIPAWSRLDIFRIQAQVRTNTCRKWLEPNSYEIKDACKPKPA